MLRNNKKQADGIITINTYSRYFNVILIVLCFCFLLGIRMETNTVTTGDEPHYLLMDYSLVHDHDLNLANNYQNRDYASFYTGATLKPQGAPIRKSGNKVFIYAPHGIGIPLFLAPGFLIATKTGAVLEMVILATAVIWLAWVWTYLVTKNRILAYLAASALLICDFFTSLSGYIYPDMMIAALVLASLIIIEKYYRRVGYQILLGFLMGFLILVHFKTLAFIGPASLVLVYKLWKSDRKLPWSTAIIILGFLLYYLQSFHVWFGAPYSAAFALGGTNFGTNPFTSLSAMLFDSNRGILVFNPILLLVFVGLPIWYKSHRESFVITLVTILPMIYVLTRFVQWNGGYAPPGRYLMESVPALIPAIAFALIKLVKVWQRIIVGIIAMATLFISLDASLTKFPLLDPNNYKTVGVLFVQIQRHTGLALNKLLPTYTTTMSNVTYLVSRHNFIKLSLSYLTIIGLLIYGWVLSRSIPSKKLSVKKS